MPCHPHQYVLTLFFPDLRLTFHIHRIDGHWILGRRPFPERQWWQPLYDLHRELMGRSLRSMEVKLVANCDATRPRAIADDTEREWMTYGSTPRFLSAAPFKVTLVPRGYHGSLYHYRGSVYDGHVNCFDYGLEQDGGEE